MNRSLAAVLPVDWARENRVAPGDVLDIEYNGEVRINPARKRTDRLSDSGVAP